MLAKKLIPGIVAVLCVGTVHAAEEAAEAPKETTKTVEDRIEELRYLGRHAQADGLATDAGYTIYRNEIEIQLPQSYKETMDGGDDPFTPGCVCCYEDRNCSIVEGRSVDECFPGGEGGDDLSENIAPTTCTQGVACAKRKKYKCSELAPGSVCRLQDVTCCGVATTSGYCELSPVPEP